MADGSPPFTSPTSPAAPLPRVRGLASQLAATRSVVASWRPADGGGGRSRNGSSHFGDPGPTRTGAGAAPAGDDPAAVGRAASAPDAARRGGTRGAAGSGGEPLANTSHTPLTAAMTATMPEYTLLGRSARARAWLPELWDPTGPPPPDSPPLSAAALEGSVACERVLRFPAPAPAGPGEDAPTFGPADEADGSGLGPALAVLTCMAVPVEAPPLRRWWTATAGGGGAAEAVGDAHAATAAAGAAHAHAGAGVSATAYDEDDEVVTLQIVMDVQRDLLQAADLGPLRLPPAARGVFHRRTGEFVSLVSAAAGGDSPWTRLLMFEHFVPTAAGAASHTITALGVGARGGLALLRRTHALMVPAQPAAPAAVLAPTDGVAALAAAVEGMSGSYGLAYAPCPVGPAAAAAASAPDGGATQLVPLVLTCARASVAGAFRMRRAAVAALVPLAAPRAPPDTLGGAALLDAVGCPRSRDGGGEGFRCGGGGGGGGGHRRPHRKRVDVTTVASAAERARIMRNRAAAARSNAARKARRIAGRAALDAQHRAGGGGNAARGVTAVAPPPRAAVAAAAAGGGGTRRTGGPAGLRVLLPRPS